MSTNEGERTYDPAGQLTSVTLPNGRIVTYRYDAAGNRISVTDNGTTTGFVTNNLNQYTTVGTTGFAYDGDGNLVSKSDTSGTTTYTYDNRGRLVSVTTHV